MIGTFVISWSQTEIDGLAGAPVGSVETGASWRWRGRAVRIDGPSDLLVLTGPEGGADLRARAGRAVRRILGAVLPQQGPGSLADVDEPLLDRHFVVSDGRRTWTVILIEVEAAARPLLMFQNEVPPEDTDLWVVRHADAPAAPERRPAPPAGVICFAEGTLVATPQGPRPVEALRPGDRIDTRDDGPQPVLWIGSRRVSGALMHAIPDLRPIRIRSGALGRDHPHPDLVVSPLHRVLLRGTIARDLFNTPEVLVTARDLRNDRTIRTDHAIQQVRYFHLLMERHQILRANGIEAESFHPADIPLDTIEADQRAELLEILPEAGRNPLRYGPPARRALSRSEAAILLHEARGRH